MTTTATDPIGLVLTRFKGVKSAGEGKWTALCPDPGHDDHVASLSIKVCPDGTVLLKCHRGCDTQAVLAAVDLEMKDLFPKGTSPNGGRSIVATYDYRCTFGSLLFQVVRFRPKGFAQRRPDGAGGWLWNLKGISPVLYKLQELTKAHSDRWVLNPEGEPHVDRLVELGFVATTSPGGALKWRHAYAESLKDRRVAILPDNDAVGRRHAEQVAASLAGKAQEVKVVELPGLGEHGDVLDWLADGGDRDQLIALVEAAPAWKPQAASPEVARAVIETKGVDLSCKTAAVISTLRGANDPPQVFVRGGDLVRMKRDEKGAASIEPIGTAELRHRVAEVMTFEGHPDPPKAIVENVMAAGGWPFPAAVALIGAPALRPDGTVIDRPGYDPATGLIYDPAPGFVVPPTPAEPTPQDVAAAVELVDEAIDGFAFVDDEDRANAVGLMLTPIVRPAIDGEVPLAILDKPQPRTGGTTLAALVGIVATGAFPDFMTEAGTDDEWQKRITATLMSGPSVVLIDNVTRPLRSPHLAAMLTTPTWQDRLLGVNKMVRLPQRATWVASGNNVKVGGDLPARCYWIKQDAHTAKPWDRTFRHPDLLAWAAENRGQLVAALLTMARAWFAAGKPEPAEQLPTLAGFNPWVKIVGGVLAHAGIDGFLRDAAERIEQADQEADQWSAFLLAWWLEFGSEAVGTATIERHITPDSEGRVESADLRAAVPDVLKDVLENRSRSFPKSLGRHLATIKERRFNADGLRVVEAGDRKKSKLWVVKTDE